MFDVFIKFSEYSFLVRSLVAIWVVFTAFVGLVAIFAKPTNKTIEQPKQTTTPENSFGSKPEIKSAETQVNAEKPPKKTTKKIISKSIHGKAPQPPLQQERTFPTAVRVDGSHNITVTGVTATGRGVVVDVKDSRLVDVSNIKHNAITDNE